MELEDFWGRQCRIFFKKDMTSFDLWQEVAQVNNKWRGKSRGHLASPDLSRKWPLYMCVCIVYVNFNCLLIMCFRLCCSVISRLSNRLLESVPWQVVLLSAKSSASVLHFVAHWHTTVKLLKFTALLAFRLLTLLAGNLNTEPCHCHSVPLIHLQHMALCWLFSFITFRTSRRWCEVYIGHACLCVCLSVRDYMPTLLHRPGCNLATVPVLFTARAMLARS